MRLPRVRFTIRRMMVAVAVVALALVLLIPVANRLIWLYQTPGSVNFATASINYRPVRSTRTVPAGQPRFPVGQPVPAQCTYKCGLIGVIPAGLIYRASIEAKLIDQAGTVVETLRRSHFLIAGLDSWKRVEGVLTWDLTPRRPGRYTIRYELHVTDLFGRKARDALNQDGFQAR